MEDINLKGMIPAAIVPMTADRELNFDAYALYIEWLISENAIAIAVNMDTGEGPQLSPGERQRVAEVAVAVANGRCAIVAGVMGATTAGAVQLAQVYRDAGVDGLVVFPNAAFRNDPLDPRIPVDYHLAVAEAADLPIVLFQLAPVFGGVNYTRETLRQLLDIRQVAAIKEASFDAQYFAYTAETIAQSGRDVALLTGNDRFITESFVMGANGALLGFGAVGCGMVAEMIDAFAGGEIAKGVAMRARVQRFADVIYADPVLDYRARCKVALAHLGIIKQSEVFVRLPLLSINSIESEDIRQALIEAGMM